MTGEEAERRLACYLNSGPVADWTSERGYATIPVRGEAHPSEETDR